MPRIDSEGQGCVTWAGMAEEELTTRNPMPILSEHSVIGADGMTKLLPCDCKREHAQNYKLRTCKCGKLGKSYILTKYRCPCRYKVKSSAVKVVTSLSSAGTPVPVENVRGAHRKGKDYWD